MSYSLTILNIIVMIVVIYVDLYYILYKINRKKKAFIKKLKITIEKSKYIYIDIED